MAPQHTAKSLFAMNIESASEIMAQHKGLKAIRSTHNTDWLLRAAVVFTVSALDTYFHDKIKYRVGRYSMDEMPAALARFSICLNELPNWEKAKRKGNVIRNWITDDLAVRSLQNPAAIADSLRLIGIEDFWNTVESDKARKKELLTTFKHLVARRNQIAHEGDREHARSSGKRLRPIDEGEVQQWIDWSIDLVGKIERWPVLSIVDTADLCGSPS